MRRTLLLTRASLRRRRGQTAILVAFIALAAAVLTLGLVVGLRYAASHDQAAARANAPDLSVLEHNTVYDPDHLARIADRADTVACETEAVFASGAKAAFGDGQGQLTMIAMFVDAAASRSMDLIEVRPGALQLEDGDVYLPYYFAVAGGYQIGDTFDAARGEDRIVLTVAGFTDEAVFGSPLYQWYRLPVSAGTLAQLADRFPDGRATLITAQFADRDEAGRIAADYASTVLEGDQAGLDAVASGAAALEVADWETMRRGRVFFAGLLVAILLAFALAVGLVALVMVRFRIVADIDEATADFGALGALGYTSGQIAAGTLLGVAAVVGAGAAAGVLLGHAALPTVAEALSAQSALTWRPGFDWAAAGICLGGIVGAALIVGSWACWRLRRLTPLTALRGGLETHDFKRDRLPLRRLRARLPWALALKAGLRVPAQLVTIALVVAPTAFMATAALGAYENTAVRKDNFWRTVGGEVPDVVVEVADPVEAPGALAEIEALGEVRQALEYSNTLQLRLNGELTQGLATADFSKFEGSLLYRGRFPIHPNEVAISARHAELLGLGVGDEVRLAAAGDDAAYLVTGLVQTLNENGLIVTATSAGLERIWPDRPWTFIGVYLRDQAGAEDFTRRLEAGGLIGPALLGALNLRQMAEVQLGVYGSIMAALAAAMLVIAAAVTTLVLVGVLGAAVRRQRPAFGVQRALGFTTGQLVRQVAATYWPAAAAGVALGCAAGWALFPSLMGAMFRSLGIYSVNMAASGLATAALAAGLAAFALAVTLALAAAVRRASAYALVSE
ncbi:MAG: hypothetical protein LBG60_08660 [Bifidobacteriaceae bacterium]|jgi:putative ABC transport system permease protein|nr:hypothetical protein [Bifidobacteriaceae bacterium]